MAEIDREWLIKQGIKTVDRSQMDRLVALAEDELEMRVGTKIVDKLTDKQIKEFESLDEDVQLPWLEKAYPTYSKIVHSEYEAMAQEIQNAMDKVKCIESWARSRL